MNFTFKMKILFTNKSFDEWPTGTTVFGLDGFFFGDDFGGDWAGDDWADDDWWAGDDEADDDDFAREGVGDGDFGDGGIGNDLDFLLSPNKSRRTCTCRNDFAGFFFWFGDCGGSELASDTILMQSSFKDDDSSISDGVDFFDLLIGCDMVTSGDMGNGVLVGVPGADDGLRLDVFVKMFS